MDHTRDITVLGGGAGGLLTALIMANGGHRVIVLERDPQPPPATDDEAWHDWDRTGVNQFRQPHGFLGRACRILAAEVPAAWEVIDSIGVHVDPRRLAPDPAGLVDDDARFGAVAVRRASVERQLALAADEHPLVDVRRGVVATGLLTGAAHRPGSPHVTGVSTRDHGNVTADLVIDACGRRTPVGAWLTELGCPVEESAETDGFTYFSRWYAHDDHLPEMQAGLFGGLAPGIAALIFPGDANTCGVAMVGSARDPLLRRLRDPERFGALAGSFPFLAPWVDPGSASPLTDVLPMGSIQNRHLRLRTADTLGATGIVNTSDSVVSTNPSLGRGVAVAGALALELRDLLATDPDATELGDRWDEIQCTRHLPWLDDAIQADTLMRDAIEAMVDGRPPGPPAHPDRAALQRAATVDTDCWRAWTEMNHIFRTPPSVTGDLELMARAHEAAADAPPPPGPSMTRAELESLLS